MCNLPCMALMMKLSRDIFLKFTAINIMTFIFYVGKVADTVNTLLDGILVHCRLALRPSPGHLPSPPPPAKEFWAKLRLCIMVKLVRPSHASKKVGQFLIEKLSDIGT